MRVLFIGFVYNFSCEYCIALYLFMSLMHCIFYRIDAETEVAYELIAETVQKSHTSAVIASTAMLK